MSRQVNHKNSINIYMLCLLNINSHLHQLRRDIEQFELRIQIK